WSPTHRKRRVPELPEVETVRAGLAAHVLGRSITRTEVYSPRAVRRQAGGEAEFAALLTGRTIHAAVRRGKFCWLLLTGPDGHLEDHALLAHLGMSGQLLVRSRPGGSHRHLRVRLSMDDGGQVWFVDQRTFGYLTVEDLVPTADGGPGGFAGFDAEPQIPDVLEHAALSVPRLSASPGEPDVGVPGEPGVEAIPPGGRSRTAQVRRARPAPAAEAEPPLPHPGMAMVQVPPLVPRAVAHIGRDLLDPLLAPGTPGRAELNRRLRRGRRDIKRALLDQTLTSGIGNIYADEALWRARVHYQRSTDRLPPATVTAILDAATDVMREALAAGGTSFDALYVNVDGDSGYFERALAVYGREGEPCPRCGGRVIRESFMNRSSYLCRRCQRRPARG
ncbi:MAG TPA: DNA-formamidopyrimidine glycosylase family protein, partial [Beutenbergiaceae bacterium]|nr:DNA-formamidopyrimidine glycosylase family protein [Beutenbergiaceae bacterium]